MNQSTLTSPTRALEARAIDIIRGLAMDAPHAARSGHQGTAMALAPLAHVLWTRVMNYDPTDPEWPDRDRFVLSAGHASILLYSMLYVTGYDLELADLEQFRQWGSRTPGHPEVHHTAGVEVTTGPLGQGFANAVGLAMAERSLRARLGDDICNHFTYVVCSDGDLSEGISHEAASLAGHQGLGRLIAIYDDNHISIDGPTELALSDDAGERFRAYGWHVQEVGEIANDCDAIEAAIRRAMAVEDRPSIIVLRSHIAYPSPDALDTAAAHGYALFDKEIAATKRAMGLPEDQLFYVPDDVLDFYRANGARGAEARAAWTARHAARANDVDGLLFAHVPSDLAPVTPTWSPGESIATRVASGAVLEALLDSVPALVAGGADLTSNTGTVVKKYGTMSAGDPGGRQIYFGVREHAMGGIMNGLALHGGVIPVGGTFLVFSDYMRGAVRLAAISRARVIYSWTHDSVGVGEDGPTHQPIEQIAALRAMPGLRVVRPADANETASAWRMALVHEGPTALILSRQNVTVLEGTGAPDTVECGAYVLDRDTDPQLILLATGSEVSLCVTAAGQLRESGVRVSVVSMPCWDLFEDQPDAYRLATLPPSVPTLSVEAACTFGWDRYADATVGIDRFGASAPGGVALEKLGINVGNVVAKARALLGDR
ncbi:MAG TPA: transketolase [Acidimicrobiales bacterium]|nr:transketolase [Acidimicrobiales bacterium]